MSGWLFRLSPELERQVLLDRVREQAETARRLSGGRTPNPRHGAILLSAIAAGFALGAARASVIFVLPCIMAALPALGLWLAPPPGRSEGRVEPAARRGRVVALDPARRRGARP
jgi:hypothetical protein